MWDPSSSTRDQTCTHCPGRPRLNHWTTREVLLWSILSENSLSQVELLNKYLGTCSGLQFELWPLPVIAEHKSPPGQSGRRHVEGGWITSYDWGAVQCQVASVMSDSVRPRGLQPARLLCPWDSPGKNTGVVPFPSPGDLPDPGIKPTAPALAGGFFTPSTKAHQSTKHIILVYR